MKKMIMLACMGLMLAASAIAVAGPQQEKMKMCNKDAAEKALKGDERKAFMKDCLSKKAEAPAGGKQAEAAPGAKGPSQRQKMSACNQSAKEKSLQGDERKKFVSECLKG